MDFGTRKNVAAESPRLGLATLTAVALIISATSCTSSASKKSATTTATLSEPPTYTTSTTEVPVTGPPTTVATTVSPVDTDILVYGDCTHPTVEPTEIVFACADYGEVLEQIHWSAWTASDAIGVGVLHYKYCVPNCASGGLRQVDNTAVTLSKPMLDPNGRPVWSQARVSPLPPDLEGIPQPQSLVTRPD